MNSLKYITRLIGSLALLFLFACGGGGGSDNSPSLPTPTSPEQPVLSTDSAIIADVSTQSLESIKAAARALADAKYTGDTSLATIDDAKALHVSKLLFASDENIEFPYVARGLVEEMLQNPGSIDTVINCSSTGTASIKGIADTSNSLKISINYDRCQDYQLTPSLNEVNGTMAFVVEEIDDNNLLGFTAYDDVSFKATSFSSQVKLSGLYNFAFTEGRASVETVEDERETQEYITVAAFANKTTFIDRKISINADNETRLDTGSIYIEQGGHIKFSAANFKIDRYPSQIGYIDLEGVNTSRFEILPPHERVKLLVDTNLDGSYDKGLYFGSARALLQGESAFSTLTDLNVLTLPPESVWIDFDNGLNGIYTSNSIFTSSTITAKLHNLQDEDTALEQLVVTYNWFVNDQPKNDISTSNYFPPYHAVHGDEVSLVATVFDGVNSVPSARYRVEIEDSAPELNFTNVPELVSPGDRISFTSVVRDPDLPGSEQSAQFISLPKGASVNNDGELTWEVPEDSLFAQQSYVFQANIQYDGYLRHPLKDSIEIQVQSEKELPVITSQVGPPISDKSLYVGNFDNETGQELLATDNKGTIYLMGLQNNGLQRKWVYPFAIDADTGATQGLFLGTQITPIETTATDSKKEILVNQYGVLFIIDDLGQKPREVLRFDSAIETMKAADLNGDGIDELILGTSTSNGTRLYIYRWDRFDIPLYIGEFNLISSIAVGNVDLDPALEIVLSEGSILDTQNWQIEWQNADNFAGRNLILADVNGNGIKEIVGKPADDLLIHSAVSRTQLAAFDLTDINGLSAVNIDDDLAEELVFGDVGKRQLQVLDFADGELHERYTLEQDSTWNFEHFTLGDIDNDGKAEAILASINMHSNPSRYSVVELGQSSQDIRDYNEVIAYSYSFAGWASVNGIDSELVYLIEADNDNVYGARFLSYKDHDNQTVSDALGNWQSDKGVVNDFNKDGFGDLFVNQVSGAFKGVSALQLSDLGQWHEAQVTDLNSEVKIIDAFDMNGDGKEEMIYAIDETVVVFDLYNNEELGRLTLQERYGRFKALKHGEMAYIVAVFNSELILLQINEAGLSSIDVLALPTSCNILSVVKADVGANHELLCASPNNQNTSSDFSAPYVFRYYGIDQDKLQLSAEYFLQNEVSALVPNPNNSDIQTYFAIAEVTESNKNRALPRIVNMNKDGSINWKGPQLIGDVFSNAFSNSHMHSRLNENGKVELHISTDQHEYLILE
ncbi:hypothetical protein ACOI22_11035 [Glaciecola sp. 2405UD65-10]|uniref:hypothetical protein n=1 Tax=Glaciecola sp. 2405UD65-10 TaxID=3397244 RepID=UPI003B5BB754